jgi:hypothetical protein
VHVVKVTGGQWYWALRDGGYTAGDQSQANTKKTKLMPLLLSRQLWKIRVLFTVNTPNDPQLTIF